MTSPNYPGGPGLPSFNGDNYTVDAFLREPTRLTNQIVRSVDAQSISRLLYRRTPTNTGTLIYEKARLAALGVNPDPNRQPGEVAAGGEFPFVGVDDQIPDVARTRQFGGQFAVTDIQKRRDSRDVMAVGVTRLSNQLALNSNARAVNAFYADTDIPTMPSAAVWSTSATTLLDDIDAAVALIDGNEDFGYRATTAIIHTDDARTLKGNKEVRGLLPRENTALNPLLSRQLAGIADLNWIVTNKAVKGKVIITQSQAVGTMVEEEPIHTEAYREPGRKRTLVIVSHMDIPVITDPKAAVILTGVSAP